MSSLKKTNLIRIAVVMCAALILSCTLAQAQSVNYQAMPGTNFASFHTYQWANIPGGMHPDQITDQEIRQAVDSQLATKGFTKTTNGNPDLYVCYQIAVDQERQWNAMGGGFRFGGMGMGTATSSTISNGTLVLDFYVAATKTQVWQGRATKTLNPSSNQQKNIKNLNNGIAKLMKNFPPPNK
jgi:hypothetical protein